MKPQYRSYKDEVDLDDEYSNVLLRTAQDVQRPACPVCKTDTYVTPMQYGLPDAPDLILTPDDETPTVTFARVTYSCEVEGYDWDCAKCCIRF